ncbi:hypothetical protein V8F20_009733 [Naviculisporaceae sp. PSN 640]
MRDLGRRNGDAGVTVNRTVQMLQNEDLVRRLCLMLPFDLTKSLVKHTLAYDFKRPCPPNPPHTYSPDIRGVYAVGISIQGRGGKFLTGREIRDVVVILNDYIDGVEAWAQNHESWDKTNSTHAYWARHICSVDDHFINTSPRPWDPPRWFQGRGFVIRARALIQMLTRLADAATATGTDNVPMVQSPVMVGCTQETMAGESARHLGESGLENTIPTYGLTLCAIASYNQLVPEPVAVPILATVQPEELPAGEMLLTTLAQSLVTQTGFNVVEGGGTSDRSDQSKVDASMIYVYETVPWFRQHMAAYSGRMRILKENSDAWQEIRAIEKRMWEKRISMRGLFTKDLEIKSDLDEWQEIRKEELESLDEVRELHLKIRKELLFIKDQAQEGLALAEPVRKLNGERRISPS